MVSCGFPFIFYTYITLHCLEIESPFQRQWIRRTESIPLGLRGRTNFAAGPIKASSCALLLKVCSSCSQDGRAGEDAARHARCWLSPPTFPSFPVLFLRYLALCVPVSGVRWFKSHRCHYNQLALLSTLTFSTTVQKNSTLVVMWPSRLNTRIALVV